MMHGLPLPIEPWIPKPRHYFDKPHCRLRPPSSPQCQDPDR